MKTVAVYVLSIVAINAGFSHLPELEILWAILAGTVFVSRDFAQKVLGHHVVWAMAAAIVLSYLTADPYVALASCVAFAVSELIDWGVFSTIAGPFSRKVLLSSVVSVPIDSALFLLVAGFFSWELFAIQVAAKLLSAGAVFAITRHKETCLADNPSL